MVIFLFGMWRVAGVMDALYPETPEIKYFPLPFHLHEPRWWRKENYESDSLHIPREQFFLAFKIREGQL